MVGRPVLSPSHGTRAPTALCLSLPVTQDSRKKFRCVPRIPSPTRDNALLPPSIMASALAPCPLLVPLAARAPERMLLLPGSPLWQCPLALKLCQGKQFPLISQLRQQRVPSPRGQLSSGWLPRGPAYAGNCIAELRGAQDSQGSLRGDLPASSVGLREQSRLYPSWMGAAGDWWHSLQSWVDGWSVQPGWLIPGYLS